MSEAEPQGIETGSGRLALIFWTSAAMLLGYLALLQLGTMIGFMTSRVLLPWVMPFSLIASLVVVDYLGRKRGLAGGDRLWPAGIALAALAAGIGVSLMFFDLSYDGQWYHQTAIYKMAQGWNPLTNPIVSFPSRTGLWVRHYAKGPWYAAVATMSFTGNFESAKCGIWAALAAAFLAASACGLDAGLRRGRALTIGAVAALNPVAIIQLTTFLVDDFMVCYLICFAAAEIGSLRKGNPLLRFIAISAAIGAINSKQTGLVFLCFICAGACIHCLMRCRRRVLPLAGRQLLAIGLGALVWGYNPYVTNTIYRKQPFYPQLGSAEYPSLAAQNKDAIERFETPKNLRGRSRFVRFAYGIFGRPSPAPYNHQDNAELMWPFTARLEDLNAYRILHDARIAGLGPYFSGVFLLGLLLAGWMLARDAETRWPLLLWSGVIVASLSISVHLWWPRYGPQMWWLPLLPAIAAFEGRPSPRRAGLAWAILALMLFDSAVVFGAHLQWEIASTRTLTQQLTELRESGRRIQIVMPSFATSVGERLKTWGIPYDEAPKLPPDGQHELMSVAKGINGAVYYCYE